MSTNRDPFTNRRGPVRMQGRRAVGQDPFGRADPFERFDRDFDQHFRTVRRVAIGWFVFVALMSAVVLGLLAWLGFALYGHFIGGAA